MSRGSPLGLLQALSYCDDVNDTLDLGDKMLWISTLLGVALMFLVGVLGKVSIATSAVVSLYQLLWLVPIWIISRRKIR